MKLVFVLSFVLIAVALSALQEVQEKYLLDLSAKKFNWMIEKQLDSLSIYLDERVLYIHSNGLIQNKEDMLKDFSNGNLTLSVVEIEEAKVRAFGSTAVLTGKGSFSGIINALSFQVKLLYTEVYVYDNYKWKLVSRHANKVQ